MKDAQTGWYLVSTKPRQETIAKLNLEQQGFNLYFPLIQKHKRQRNVYKLSIEPMFPSYLFIYLISEKNDWSKIRSTRGCLSLVRFGTIPARVPENLITSLKQDEVKRFEKSDGDLPIFKPGDRVRIVDGALANYEGIVNAHSNQQRISLLLTLSENYSRYVTLPIDQIILVN